MWFTETPWPPFIILSIISAGFFALWYAQRRPRQLQASIAFLALGGLVIIVEQLIVTESERVEANVYALVRAFEAQDGDRCAGFFSAEDPTDRDLVRNAAHSVHVDGSVRVTDLSVQMSSAESRAISTFRASATVTYQRMEGHGYTRWELTWQKEANEWKIVRVRRLKFVGEGEMPPLSAPE
jgi:hypothetical protein